eukprot:TRINITY_DN27466_c0_g1_i1.p1 TRINITY_DN27466_c0_g1~~TRINITY_DN27466_c0_g1_i1.p1  ORF type:complete len:651 (-),score=123.85 TRINITY_DN27466_c0_g1_i1:88-2040(-)
MISSFDSWSALKKESVASGCSGEASWLLAASDFDQLLKRILPKSKSDAPPPWVLNMWSAAYEQLVHSTVAPTVRYMAELPQGNKDELGGGLLPYQEEAVRFGIARGGRFLCADEMGLGKTVTSLAIAAQWREEWPVLVVCPPMIRHQWRSEILRWLGHLVQPEQVQLVMQGRAQIQIDALFIIVPYSLITQAHFHKRQNGDAYKIVICDESHYIKEQKAQRTQSVVPLLQSARRAILLSGTPSLNHAAEMYTQVQAVLGSHVSQFRTFAERYSHRKIMRFGTFKGERWSGVQREEELGVLMRHVMIRRLKQDVLKELPAKRRQRVVVQASDAAALRDANSQLSALDASNPARLSEDGVAGHDNQEDLRDIFKMICAAKLKSTQDYIGYLLDGIGSGKMLLFAHHIVMLDAIEQTLRSRKVRFIRIDGQVAQQQRPRLIQEFQEDPDVACAILSITACGEGLNLTVASTVVFGELYWVPGIMEQCEARAHRMGQTSMVDVHYIVVEGSIDERAYASLSHKKQAVGSILDGKAGSFDADANTKISPEDEATLATTVEERAQDLVGLRAARTTERLTKREAAKAERDRLRQEKAAATDGKSVRKRKKAEDTDNAEEQQGDVPSQASQPCAKAKACAANSSKRLRRKTAVTSEK